MEINPALVIGVGPHAGDILRRVQELLLANLTLDSLPEIFRLVEITKDSDIQAVVGDAYLGASRRTAANIFEEATGRSVDSSRLESYVIATPNQDNLDAIVEVGRTLKTFSGHVVAGGRNAVLLLPGTKQSNNGIDPENTVLRLDAELRTAKCFNRCFLVDHVDDLGRSITSEERIELIARFVSLAIGSELSKLLKTNPPPYVGDGQFKSYASFGCASINFDAQRLVGLLAGHLANDITQNLFSIETVKPEEGEWRDRIKAYESSPDQPFIASANIELADIQKDPDFERSKVELDELIQSICPVSNNSFHKLLTIINRCMQEKSVRLEKIRQEMTQIKKKINGIEIKILLNQPCDEKVDPVTIPVKKTPWVLIIALLTAGAGITTALLVLQPVSYLIAIAVAALFLLIVLILAFTAGKKFAVVDRRIPISCEAELKRLSADFAAANKRLNIQVGLFVYLDLAYANIESLRRNKLAPEPTREWRGFDIDLINEDAVAEYYLNEYESKESDIAGFLDARRREDVYRSLFSFFESKLIDNLVSYSRRRFKHLTAVDLDRLFRTSELLNQRQVQIAAAPLWYPGDPARSERTVFAIIPEATPEPVRNLIRGAFVPHSVHYVQGQSTTEATILQIAFDQSLEEILTPHSPAAARALLDLGPRVT
jgi:hypothetical protein